MNDTKIKIVDLANELIRSIGYNAFSYADISKELGIKNAAIHYYFPTKSDLGIEVIHQNLNAFNSKKEEWKTLNYREQLENYITLHDDTAKRKWVCIVGALSPSFDTLPSHMQKELQFLINTILDWLTELLHQGLKKGTFSFSESPKTKALIIHSALLSSLQMNKVFANNIYKTIQNGLLNI